MEVAATRPADDPTPSRRIERVCNDVIDSKRPMRSFPQGIDNYTYFKGEPLLIVTEPPKTGEYPDHKHVVHQTTRRQRLPRGGVGLAPAEVVYHLYSKREDGRWKLKVGTQFTVPTQYLNVDKLKACADNPQNAWGSSFTGTLEQVNAQTPKQYEDLYEAVGVDPTSKISIRQANLKVNGASLLFRYICSFRT